MAKKTKKAILKKTSKPNTIKESLTLLVEENKNLSFETENKKTNLESTKESLAVTSFKEDKNYHKKSRNNTDVENKNDLFSKNSLKLSKFKSPDIQKRPIISVSNLVKKYDNLLAIDNISFEVKRGEIFGILGPNGAGKTTTLEIMETILEKTSGTVIIDGLDIDIYSEQVKKLIGVQLQNGGYLPNLNLIEILELFADIYNVYINPMDILKTVNLQDKAYTFVDKLSGGQQQRFSIATTLIAQPMVVFLDEPTTGLDPQARRNLWEKILEIKESGKTVVMTTHYMDEAEYLCDRIAIMDGGKILKIDTADNFIKDLLDRGFEKRKQSLDANLEDVFLDLTGKSLRD